MCVLIKAICLYDNISLWLSVIQESLARICDGMLMSKYIFRELFWSTHGVSLLGLERGQNFLWQDNLLGRQFWAGKI